LHPGLNRPSKTKRRRSLFAKLRSAGFGASVQRTEPLQFGRIEHCQYAIGQAAEAAGAKDPEYAINVYSGKTNRIRNVALLQRKGIAIFANHVSCLEAAYQMRRRKRRYRGLVVFVASTQ
jgi:hypothetical protein